MATPSGPLRMNDYEKARCYLTPEFIPVSVSILPAAWMKYRTALFELTQRHPVLFDPRDDEPDYDHLAGGTYVAGDHVDAWGCVWSNVHSGREAIVTGHPVPRREDVRTLKAPMVDAGMPHGFMFLRLMDLRGYEELMIDFAEEPPELQQLIDIVLAYNMRQLELSISESGGDRSIWFGDDLGTQKALPIRPETWRKYLKPCYAKLYERCHEEGIIVHMHTDGCIYEIIPDLIECGVDVLNPQVRANGLENLARTCKGKVCVQLDLDRQLFPFATAEEIHEHVRSAIEALGAPEGGLCLSAEVDDGVPIKNIEAICCALETHREVFTQ
jgi:uroporphyrinogen decarboxylase